MLLYRCLLIDLSSFSTFLRTRGLSLLCWTQICLMTSYAKNLQNWKQKISASLNELNLVSVWLQCPNRLSSQFWFMRCSTLSTFSRFSVFACGCMISTSCMHAVFFWCQLLAWRYKWSKTFRTIRKFVRWPDTPAPSKWDSLPRRIKFIWWTLIAPSSFLVTSS